MTAYSYTDTSGVERVMRARSAEHATSTVLAIECNRSGSIAAAQIAARSLSPLTPEDFYVGQSGAIHARALLTPKEDSPA